MSAVTRRAARHTAALGAGAVLGLAALTGCGDSEQPAAATSDPDPAVIAVQVEGDSVTPNGERVEVAVGQSVELDVTADAAGEIHVHSDPEQELEYAVGETTLTIAPIQRPGIVDVESHALDKTIVQLQVQ